MYVSRMVDVSTATPSPRRPVAKPQRVSRLVTSGRAVASERRATLQDWLRIPEEKRAELIQGRIVYHTFPDLKHGNTQARISGLLHPYDRRRKGGGGGGGAPELGGWWLSQEVDMALADVGCRPDIIGWRRDKHTRVPQPDARGVITATPDFLCEVLSPSTARYDKGEKREAYFRAGVPYYWLVEPALQTLTVLERTDRGYLIVRVAGPGETVRAAPFEEVEIPVDELFMDEEGEVPAAEAATPPAAFATTPPLTAKVTSGRASPRARAAAAPAPASPPPKKKKRAPRRRPD